MAGDEQGQVLLARPASGPRRPAGQLAGTSLAHAKANACAQLAPGRYRDYTLWATLEPCPLCTAVAMITGCGQVRFLAADPVWHGAGFSSPAIQRHSAA